MAFEQPLDADRMDGPSPFVNFIASPLLGTLEWVLNKVANEDKDDSIMEGVEDLTPPATDTLVVEEPYSEEGLIYHNANQNASELSLIRRAYSTLDLCENQDQMRKVPPSLVAMSESDYSSSLEWMLLSCEEPATENLSGKSKKTLSWSDESGKELAIFWNQNPRHEPKPSMEPVKSALSRSRSVRDNASSLVDRSCDGRPSHYLPKSITRRSHGGIVMPNMSRKTEVNSSGEYSPQWGWYINTTPPTQEVYAKNVPKQMETSGSTVSTGTTTTGASFASTSVVVVGEPNPIFQNLRDKHKIPMGWPSVPI